MGIERVREHTELGDGAREHDVVEEHTEREHDVGEEHTEQGDVAQEYVEREHDEREHVEREHVEREHTERGDVAWEREHVGQESTGQTDNVQDRLDEVGVDWNLDVEWEDLTSRSVASVPVAFASNGRPVVHDL